MELIDTHQHLMYRDQVGYSWANEFPPIDKGNFTLEDYQELTGKYIAARYEKLTTDYQKLVGKYITVRREKLAVKKKQNL